MLVSSFQAVAGVCRGTKKRVTYFQFHTHCKIFLYGLRQSTYYKCRCIM